MIILFGSNVAVLAHSPDNTTQQMRLCSGHDTAEADGQTSTTPQPTHGSTTSWAREPMSSKGPDSLWAAISVYQSVISASGVGTRPQKNKSHPFFPNTTVAVASTPGAARISGANLGQMSSALNTKQLNIAYWCLLLPRLNRPMQLCLLVQDHRAWIQLLFWGLPFCSLLFGFFGSKPRTGP
jgi:hypothetical protein